MMGGLDHNSCIGKCKAPKLGPFIMGIVMLDADKTAIFAVELMLCCQALTAAFAAGG